MKPNAKTENPGWRKKAISLRRHMRSRTPTAQINALTEALRQAYLEGLSDGHKLRDLAGESIRPSGPLQ